MKRIFILLSNLLTSGFLLWVCSLLAMTLIFRYYPSVAVLEASRDISHQKLADKLTDLSVQTDSSIIRLIQEPDGEEGAVYEVFGKSKLYSDLKVASEESRQGASLLTNYYIVSGSLTPERLQDLGASKSVVHHPSLVSTLLSFVGNGSQLLAFSMFVLTFSALSVITKTRELRSAGIRVIAGQGLSFLFGKSLLADLVDFLLGAVTALVLSYLAVWLCHLPVLSAYFVTAGVLAYNLLLLLVTVFLAWSIYWLCIG